MNEPNPSIANRRATTVSMLVAVVMIAQQVAGKAARDAFFLSHFPASALPAVMVAATVLSFGVIFVISRILRTVPPAKAAPWIFTCNGALFVAEFALSGPQPHVTAVMIYLHIAALGAAAVSIFWSVVSECFDPHRAKRAIARIAVGASFGGVIGGVSGWQLGKVVSLPVLFLILALANVVCALGIASLSGPRARPTSVGKAPSAMDVMRETPYLRLLAVLVALGAMTDTVVDFVFKASAQAEYSSSGDLMSFFAIFYAVTGILTFLLQTTLVERSLRTNGLIGTVASRPGFMIGGALFVLAFPRFLSTVILRGGAQVVENSFYRSGYEILYTPLTPDKKRPTKTLIDVGLERIGVAVGAGCVLLVVALAPNHADSALFGVAALAAITSLFVCSRLHRGYVDALVDSLRAGVVKLSSETVVDRTTMHTLSQTATAIDREKLLRDIEEMRLRHAKEALEAAKSDVAKSGGDQAVDTILDLRSGDPERIRPHLAPGTTLDLHCVSHMIELLAHEHYVAEAISTLGNCGARITGQLLDAFADRKMSPSIRRHLPRILSTIGGERVLQGLVQGLGDAESVVRYKSGSALTQLTKNDTSLRIPRKLIFEAVCQEAAYTSPEVKPRRAHIAQLLSLVLDRDTIELAFRALSDQDESLRGVGLEYLENVVPAEVYKAVRPLVDEFSRAHRTVRPAKEVVVDLLNSVDTQGIDLAAIRAFVQSEPNTSDTRDEDAK